MPETHPRRIRTRDAADYIGAAPRTLEKWRISGAGPPFIKVGRLVLYDVATLDRWLAERTHASTSDQGAGATS
jgi:hypothetical protein